MCYAYSCRKAQRKPPHEMLSMKLPAELFRGQEKQEQKRQATVFLLAGSGQKPHFGNCSCQSFPQESSDRPYFTIVKSSKLYFVIFCYILMPFIRNEVTENKLIKKQARLNKLQSEKL